MDLLPHEMLVLFLGNKAETRDVFVARYLNLTDFCIIVIICV